VCLVNLGRSPEARTIFEKLLNLDPLSSDACYQLGFIYIGLGETSKAKEHLLTFIEIDPENKNVPLAKEILKTLNEPFLGRALGAPQKAGIHC